MECSIECAKIKNNPATSKTCSVISYDQNSNECKSLELKFYEKSNNSDIEVWKDSSALLSSEFFFYSFYLQKSFFPSLRLINVSLLLLIFVHFGAVFVQKFVFSSCNIYIHTNVFIYFYLRKTRVYELLYS